MRRAMIDNVINNINNIHYSSLMDLLDNYSVEVFHRSLKELGNEYSVSINNNILICDDLEPEQERFILLHELGHILLHDSKANFFSPKCYKFREEQEANYFAVKMMDEFGDPVDSVANLGIPSSVLENLKDMGMM